MQSLRGIVAPLRCDSERPFNVQSLSRQGSSSTLNSIKDFEGFVTSLKSWAETWLSRCARESIL
ncbi:MAG: hypothetical protein VX542_05355, partial [Cyanobacteriota bacterium]|nr:hypothetical protein [Cyanobacteriota bacterium]